MDSDVGHGLPFLEQPHDSMRLGLANFKEDAAPKHPVQVIQTTYKQQSEITKLKMLRDLYGVAFPAKMQIEKSILERFERLPGLPSSKLGLESLTGILDDFSFDSYLGLPEETENVPASMHSQMELKLKMETDKMTRGIL